MKNLPEDGFLVCVRCMTYNQSPYIMDALDGFCMQETTFPYICVIVDDASTDGEQDLLRKYIDDNFVSFEDTSKIYNVNNDYELIVAQHNHNRNCYFAVSQLKYNHYHKKDKYPYYEKWLKLSKFIALCEGDDYWTDSHKLQMQVEILESDINVGMVYCQCRNFVQSKQKETVKNGGPFTKFEELIQRNTIPTPTVVYRRDLYEDYLLNIKPEEKKWVFNDYPQWLYFASVSKIVFIPKVVGVYRVLNESASHTSDIDKRERFLNSSIDIKSFFSEYNGKEFDGDYQRLIALSMNAFIFNDRLRTKHYLKMMNNPQYKYRCIKMISSSKWLFFFVHSIYMFIRRCKRAEIAIH